MPSRSTPMPTGEITVLFTDIEDSTRRWQQRPGEMVEALVRHDAILRDEADRHDGLVFDHMGDGMAIAFQNATVAVEASIAMQAQLQRQPWSGEDRLKVRMGIHTGEPLIVAGEYRGPALITVARITDLTNGDQIAVSDRAARLVDGIMLRNVGLHMLKGIGNETIQLVEDPRIIKDKRPLRSSIARARTPVPTSLTPLIGRTAEIDQACAFLHERRLVTVKGVGGIGKTRVAAAVAHVVAANFPDGAAFCDLSPVAGDAQVAEALAAAIGARKQPAMTMVESIENFLRDREMLVVIDNCEHVLSAVRHLAVPLLETGRSRVLATSREPLRIVGEQIIDIGPLDPGTDGVDMFIGRAGARDGAFETSPEDRETIATICRTLDGIPLAIELATARLRVLTPAELLDRLQNRFAVLRDRKIEGRHSGLRQTIEWSYEQLDDDEATLFRRLSVFAGGFDMKAAEAVCADAMLSGDDVLDLTSSLADKSLVTRLPGAGSARFRLLETIREFAAEQLAASGEGQALSTRHAEFYVELTGDMNDLLLTGKEAEVWETLDRDWDNVRRAFGEFLAASDLEEAIGLTLDLAWYGTFAMRFEALAFAERLLDEHDLSAAPQYGSLLGVRALFAYFTADPRVQEFAEAGLRADPLDPMGMCRGALSAVYLNNLFSKQDSEALTSEWLAHATDGGSTVWAEGMRAFHLGTYGDVEGAQRHAANARTIADRSGSASASALASWAEGMGALGVDPIEADRLWRDGLERASSLGPNHLLTHLITGLRLHVMALIAEVPVAISSCLSALQNALDQHYLAGTSHLFGVAGICLARAGNPEAGGRLLATMIAHGHQPRSNARMALTQALGVDPATYDGGDSPTLSIAEAGQFAIAQLTMALGDAERSAGTENT